ncbi:MAG: hypothetical protein A3B13_01205 [Candidatus Liptonbacteria bacterium RIFCSPLOWO2_01_FULL_45_15]|uniref:DUF5667 domain-containing protein n=1 Tax=Candidatus Liptonbacteria bacterium RIFCSPLOWO2_01_FULL_45_15 TaxID=1798649 RepID=A0A1G2CGH2_9BACT|nr:MAG: hypothetical protein A3B13_01205 [Candidatus Liptonbacteria bacterium RIFCSPLOWO2_01_FULL_45_15]
MLHLSRNTKIFLGAIGVAIVGMLGFRLLSSNAVPQDFIDARIQGAIIAQNIVGLSNQSVNDIEKINQLDQQKNYAEATNVALEAIQKSRDIRNQAVELSNQVSKMTVALSGIDSFEARQAALEAISNRLALIGRLINYSDYLNQLLQSLQAKFSGQRGDHSVEVIINQINAEVTAINSFNGQSTQAMNRFDAIVNGR